MLSLGRYVSPLPLPRKNHQLVTSGMYAYLRHPQYGGLLMAAFGLAVITRSETRLALAALLWFVLDRKVCVWWGRDDGAWCVCVWMCGCGFGCCC